MSWPDLPILWKRDPGSEGCHGTDLPTINERYPGVEVLGESPRLAAMFEATGRVADEVAPGRSARLAQKRYKEAWRM